MATACLGASASAASEAAEARLRPALSPEAQQLVAWIVRSGDNGRLPFIVVDKAGAEVLAFDRTGAPAGYAPALLGLARGDDTVPGIGQRSLASIGAEERTTPAGRFVAGIGRNLGRQDVLWIDYEAGISLHRVIRGGAEDRRLQRLQTASPHDNRISYGCINVPVAFYETVVRPAFLGGGGIVYILPEERPLHAVFPLAAGAGQTTGGHLPAMISRR